MARQTLTVFEAGPFNELVAMRSNFQTPDVVNGDQFVNDGHTLVWFRSIDAGSSKLVQIPGQQTDRSCNQALDIDMTIPAYSSPQQNIAVAGFIAPRVYNDANGYVYIDYPGGTTATNFGVMVIRYLRNPLMQT